MKVLAKERKTMGRAIASFILALIMISSVLYGTTSTVNAAAENITVTNATYYDNGTLKSITANFDWDTADATGRLVLMKEKLRSAGEDGTNESYGDFTDLGYYGSMFSNFDAVTTYDNTHNTFGIISYSEERSWYYNSTNNTVSIDFNETDIPLNINKIYYVYLWTGYFGHYYPDNLIMAINVANGVVQYTPASGINSYDSNNFTTVGDDGNVQFNVSITSANHMTKTTTSGDNTQNNLNGPMTSVVYTADNGYYFPEDYTVASSNGINVSRDSETQITIYGKPTADTTITLVEPAQRSNTHTHQFDQKVAKSIYKVSDATCTSAAVYHKSCLCGEEGTQTFTYGTALKHAAAETWSTDGTNHWKVCTRKNCGLIIDDTKAPHSSSESNVATCQKKAVCDECGTEYGEVLTHEYKHIEIAAQIGINGKSYDECALCGNIINENTIAALKPYIIRITKTSWTDNSLKFSWNKVNDADGYDLFVKKCDGKPFSKTPTITTKNKNTTSQTIRKISGKSINQKMIIKCNVKAYKIVDGKKIYIASVQTIHVAAKNAKYTNAKKVTVNKSSVTLSVGKSSKITPTITKENAKKKLVNHTAKYRYWSENTNVATVSASGKIVAESKGTCYVYVMAANGQYTRVKVTVK